MRLAFSTVDANTYEDILWVLLNRPPPTSISKLRAGELNSICVSEHKPLPPTPIPFVDKPPSIFALIIGIDGYTTKRPLNAAVADADRVRRYLNTLQVPSDHIRYLTDSAATRDAIIGALQDLQCDDRIERNKSCILIFYAGHGGEKTAPPGWEAGGSKVQMILPVDYGNKLGGDVVQGIPDRTIGRLLDDLAEKKGNNITVIFDCCHSGSGSRANPDRTPRVAEALYDIPADLDQNIWGRSGHDRGTKYEPGFLHKGLRSHVFLAACSAKEKAFEDSINKQGAFTHALLSLLEVVSADQLTYAELLGRIDAIPAQNPQCEGYHRDRVLFEARVSSQSRHFRAVRKDADGKYIMNAGAAHGVTEGANFTVYKDRASALQNIALGILFVHKASTFASEMHIPPGASHLNLTEGVALQTKAGTRPDLLLHIPRDDDRLVTVFEAVAQVMESTGTMHRQISLVEKDQATLDVALDNGHCVFNILDQRVTQHGLTRVPHRVETKIDDICPVLSAAAHYYWHINRTTDTHHLCDKVEVEFRALEEVPDQFDTDFRRLRRPCGENLLKDGIVHLIADTNEMYGMKITNQTPWHLYVSVFFFDNSDFSITPYYQPGDAGRFKLDPCLEKDGGSLTLGYGSGGSPSFRYTMEGLPADQRVDVGFVKVFLTTEPVDLSNVSQESPFTRSHRMSGPKPVKGRTAKIWDTIIIPIVQRRTS